jgi:hypothetical protein
MQRGDLGGDGGGGREREGRGGAGRTEDAAVLGARGGGGHAQQRSPAAARGGIGGPGRRWRAAAGSGCLAIPSESGPYLIPLRGLAWRGVPSVYRGRRQRKAR